MKPLLTLVFVMIASHAAALSCLRPDVASSYQDAHAAEDLYYILRGRLDFDAALMPNGVEARASPPAAVPAQFDGMTLTARGFTTPFAAPIILQPSCAGPWCGSLQPSADILVFAKQTGAGLEVDVGACPWFVFYNPTDAMEQRIVDCVAGRRCERADR